MASSTYAEMWRKKNAYFKGIGNNTDETNESFLPPLKICDILPRELVPANCKYGLSKISSKGNEILFKADIFSSSQSLFNETILLILNTDSLERETHIIPANTHLT